MYFRTLITAILVGTSYGILNGKNASIKDYPYQVIVEHQLGPSCGASIISSNWVVSSAWCLCHDPDKDHLKLRAGSDVPLEGGSVHHVDKVILHEEYNRTTGGILMNDIALARVKEAFVFDEIRQPIPLFDTAEKLAPGTMANVTGFGCYKIDNATCLYPDKLQSLEVPIMDLERCNDIFKQQVNDVPASGALCAGQKDPRNVTTNPDYGDQGDPLVVNGRLAGVVSCACINYLGPVLYSDIAHHRQWIDKQLKLEEKNSIV